MLTIHLQQLLFHAYHGIHQEEQVLGNDFEVNVEVNLPAERQITSIRQTINYVDLYNLVKQHMLQPTPLLETLAQQMASAIHDLDTRIISVNITIKKMTAPIANFQGVVGVSYTTGI